MKTVVILALSVFSLAASAGDKYCRTIQAGGIGGPAGQVREAKHCVTLDEKTLEDNANTFFGNPPETLDYVRVIAVLKDGTQWVPSFTLQGNKLIKLDDKNQPSGQEFTMVLEVSAGNKYCRTVQVGGIGGPAGPVREGKHCVILEDKTLEDNANTFFGNPPETQHYITVIAVSKNGSDWKAAYTLRNDRLKMLNEENKPTGQILVKE